MTDIKVKEIKYIKKTDLFGSSLTLEFSGKNVNPNIINTIRRVSMDNIPIYAFSSENIKIEANTSIFNNDYMKLRLSQLPIYDIKEQKDQEKIIEIYINSYNNTPDIINVTTNDIKYLEDGEVKEKYSKKYPILIIQLRPNETFKAHLKSRLSTGSESAIFSASGNSYYDYDEENKINLTIESQGQLTEYEILKKSRDYILEKLNDFEKHFKEQLKSKKKFEKTMLFEFENEDHTMGEILNTVFQEHPKIIFSGISKPFPLERIIRIKITGEDNPLIYMIESIEKLKKIFDKISIKP